MRQPAIRITPDLHLRIGDAAAPLTPARGLRLAEQIARASFRKALAEEASAPPRRNAAKRPAR